MSINMTNNNFAVFLTNISNHASFEQLRFHMNKAGKVVFLKYFNKGSTKKNFAYVYYTCLSDAIRAVEMFDQTFIYNSRLFVTLHKDNVFLKAPFPNRDNTKMKIMLPTSKIPNVGNNVGHYAMAQPNNVVGMNNSYPYMMNGPYPPMVNDQSSFNFSSFRANFPYNVCFPPTPVPSLAHPSPSESSHMTNNNEGMTLRPTDNANEENDDAEGVQEGNTSTFDEESTDSTDSTDVSGTINSLRTKRDWNSYVSDSE